MDANDTKTADKNSGPIEHLNILNEDDFELIAKLCPVSVYDTLLAEIDSSQNVLTDQLKQVKS